MKYYIIAGEASGDLHGSNLIKELFRLDGETHVRAWGGEKMQQAGATIIKSYTELAFMGFAEVIKNLPTIFKNLRFCKEDILNYSPDVLVLIDYPGFNLRIAKWAKSAGIRVIYYISPQVWAWKESRVTAIKQYVDKMLVILPFEKEFYGRWNYKVDYVGHPLVEVMEKERKNSLVLLGERPIIALLPGSRKQEIRRKLPVMIETASLFPEYDFIVARAPGLPDNYYDEFMGDYQNVRGVSNDTYNLLRQSKAALVTSGTATLETALLNVPEVVCYRANTLSYQIGKRLIRIKYISLVNLIMDKLVVTELIQKAFTTENLARELNAILHDKATLQRILEDYRSLKELLSQGGHASANAAKLIVDYLSSQQLNRNNNEGKKK